MANKPAAQRAATPCGAIRCPICKTVGDVYQRSGTTLRYWACACGTLQAFKAPGQRYIAEHAAPSREELDAIERGDQTRKPMPAGEAGGDAHKQIDAFLPENTAQNAPAVVPRETQNAMLRAFINELGKRVKR